MGSLCNRPTRRARLRSRTTASSGCAISLAAARRVFMQSGLAAPGSWYAGKRAWTITRNAYMQGKSELAWDTWTNCLVLRLSQQSGNKTNDPLKSGPAKAGPAWPATPPLTSTHIEVIWVTKRKQNSYLHTWLLPWGIVYPLTYVCTVKCTTQAISIINLMAKTVAVYKYAYRTVVLFCNTTGS